MVALTTRERTLLDTGGSFKYFKALFLFLFFQESWGFVSHIHKLFRCFMLAPFSCLHVANQELLVKSITEEAEVERQW